MHMRRRKVGDESPHGRSSGLTILPSLSEFQLSYFMRVMGDAADSLAVIISRFVRQMRQIARNRWVSVMGWGF
jgi:hypothetical protein